MLTATRTLSMAELGVDDPGTWWSKIPMSSKIAYSVILMTGIGAVVGGLQTERPITGVAIGAAAGFSAWGIGATVYTGYKTVRAVEAAGKKLSSLPGL